MALKADMNKKIADQMFAIYSNAETLMLEKMTKGVSSVWADKKITDIQTIRKQLTTVVNDLSKKASTALSDAVKDSYQKGIHSAEADFKLNRTVLSGTAVPAKLVRLVQESNNIIQASSFKILRNTEDAYRRIQAEVVAGTLTGVETRKQIAKRFMNRLADEGITSFTDKKGRKWEMGAYAEMVTRTTTVQASLQGHIDRQLEAGRDLIVISDHAGECPLCRPWENKVLSITGATNGYPSLASAKEAGLFHPNCRHSLTGYIEGLTDLEPTKTGGVPGQDIYIKKQRSNERQIRRWKRREVVALDDNDKRKSVMHIQDYQANQRSLLKAYEQTFDMTLRRKYDRESIRNREGVVGKETLPQWTKTVSKKVRPPRVRKPKVEPTPIVTPVARARTINYAAKFKGKTDFSDVRWGMMSEITNKITNPQIIKAIDKVTGGFIKGTREGKGFYRPSDQSIHFDIDEDLVKSKGKHVGHTWHHEVGHAVDDLYNYPSKKPEFMQALEDDNKEFLTSFTSKKYIDSEARAKANSWFVEQIRLNKSKDTVMISDVLGGLSENQVVGKFAHSKDYWKQDKTLVAQEAFAGMFAGYINGGSEIELIKKVFPKAFSMFEKFINGI